MRIVLEIHFVVAFLVCLMALLIGWVQMGRRTMTGVLGLQVLIGLIAAGMAGASHRMLPPNVWVHIVGALLAMIAYIVARRIADRTPENRVVPLMFSFVGFVLVLFTAWYGWNLTMVAPVF